MYKIIAVVFLLVSFNSSITAQYTQQITNVRAQARIFADATIKRDYNTILKYTNIDGIPRGKLNTITMTKALKILQTVDSQMIRNGMEIKSINFGEVLSIVKEGFELQCTLAQTTETKMQFGRTITKSTLLGVSADNGVSWKFIDATGRDSKEMRRLLPHLSTRVVFANPENPKLIPEPKAQPIKNPSSKK